MEAKQTEKSRYVGIDLGKRTFEVAIVGARGTVTRTNGKTSVLGRQWLYKKLRPQDKVGLEAGNMAFIIAKELEAMVGCRVYVLNPAHLPLIYGTMKKTDKEDSLKLAHIVEYFPEERLPVVAVPSDQEMRRRKLLGSYRREQQNRNRGINRLHGLFVAQGITTLVKEDLATAENRKLVLQLLNGLEREEAEHLCACLGLYEERIAVLNTRIEEESKGDEQIERLQTVPGVGPKVSFAFAAHVAAERFENPSQVSNYLGLVPRVYISGETVRHGRITKRGNGYVRALLVQAAWAATRVHAWNPMKARFEYMTKVKGISRKKAIVAIARRIGELLYTLMKYGTSYDPKRHGLVLDFPGGIGLVKIE